MSIGITLIIIGFFGVCVGRQWYNCLAGLLLMAAGIWFDHIFDVASGIEVLLARM